MSILWKSQARHHFEFVLRKTSIGLRTVVAWSDCQVAPSSPFFPNKALIPNLTMFPLVKRPYFSMVSDGHTVYDWSLCPIYPFTLCLRKRHSFDTLLEHFPKRSLYPASGVPMYGTWPLFQTASYMAWAGQSNYHIYGWIGGIHCRLNTPRLLDRPRATLRVRF